MPQPAVLLDTDILSELLKQSPRRAAGAELSGGAPAAGLLDHHAL